MAYVLSKGEICQKNQYSKTQFRTAKTATIVIIHYHLIHNEFFLNIMKCELVARKVLMATWKSIAITGDNGANGDHLT